MIYYVLKQRIKTLYILKTELKVSLPPSHLKKILKFGWYEEHGFERGLKIGNRLGKDTKKAR